MALPTRRALAYKIAVRGLALSAIISFAAVANAYNRPTQLHTTPSSSQSSPYSSATSTPDVQLVPNTSAAPRTDISSSVNSSTSVTTHSGQDDGVGATLNGSEVTVPDNTTQTITSPDGKTTTIVTNNSSNTDGSTHRSTQIRSYSSSKSVIDNHVEERSATNP
jgi:hypothetical protein